MVSLLQKRARESMSPPVSSPAKKPWFTHSTLFRPSTSFKKTSISLRFHCPLRLGESRHSEVVSRVPSPSLSSAPPSNTKRSEERRVGKECRSQWSAAHL